MSESHEEGRKRAAAAVLEHWRRVAKAAREAGMIELAELSEKQIEARLEPLKGSK